MDEIIAMAEGIGWVHGRLEALELLGRKLEPEQYYRAKAQALRIELRLEAMPDTFRYLFTNRWAGLKRRLEAHRPR